MDRPEPLVGLVWSARRRLAGRRLVVELTLWVGIGACGAAAVWGVSRVVVFRWADQVAFTLAAAAIVSGMGWWAVHRPTLAQAALWADHRLGAEDRIATAWELSAAPAPSAAARRQVAEAGRWAERVDPARLGGVYPSGTLGALAALAVAAAVALAAAPSLTDQALDERRAARLVVEAEAERVRELAAAAPGDLSERLAALAALLEETGTVEEALSALSSARLELERGLAPDRLAENTALAGLATRLSQRPVGRGDDPASQISDLASSLGGLPAAARAAAAGELAERAADFAGINEDLSAALAEAAAALGGEGFDLGRATEALGRAASEISSARSRAAQADAAAQAAAQLRDAEGRLGSGREGTGAGGEGAASGGGSGAGQGSGAGGPGGERGAGGGGGQAGASGASGSGAGPASGTGDDDPAVAPRYSSPVFDPPAGGLGEEVRAPVTGDGPGEVAGRASGPSVANQPLVPYTERLAEFRAAALASLERRPLPSHLTAVVQSYFTELEP